MAGKRIRYILKAFAKPFGGPQQTRSHVRMLNALGYDASIVIDSDSDAHFYGDPVPRTLDRDFRPAADDICVVPEGWRRHAMELSRSPATLVCFCQNHFYLNMMFEQGEGFRTFRIADVACCSRQSANFVERYYDAERVSVLPCAVAPSHGPTETRDFCVGFMPRKAPRDARLIHDVFRRRYPAFAGVRWVAIDGLSHADARTALGRCAVFLSLSYREGFGLPPIEAMTAGALVVGFHGGGGLDYATPRNGLWRDEGDLVGCTDAAAEALALLRDGKSEAVDMVEEGRRTAARYSPDALRDALVTFWDAQLWR